MVDTYVLYGSYIYRHCLRRDAHNGEVRRLVQFAYSLMVLTDNSFLAAPSALSRLLTAKCTWEAKKISDTSFDSNHYSYHSSWARCKWYHAKSFDCAS